MTPAVGGYAGYLLLSLGVTGYVGAKLFHHGRPFLLDVFAGRSRLADATNQVLLAGFYLTNAALVLLFLTTRDPASDWGQAWRNMTSQGGVVLATLGAMHFANLAILLAVRRTLRRSARSIAV